MHSTKKLLLIFSFLILIIFLFSNISKAQFQSFNNNLFTNNLFNNNPISNNLFTNTNPLWPSSIGFGTSSSLSTNSWGTLPAWNTSPFSLSDNLNTSWFQSPNLSTQLSKPFGIDSGFLDIFSNLWSLPNNYQSSGFTFPSSNTGIFSQWLWPTFPTTSNIIYPAQENELLGKQSDFVSAGTGESNNQGVGMYGGLAYSSNAAMPAPETDIKTTTDDITREIVEADIIKIEGTNLYLLNRYRGLIICDISNPDKPSIAGRSYIANGDPEDMYIHNTRAYVIVNNTNTDPYYATNIFETKVSDEALMPSQETSSVIVVDIAEKTNPKVISSFELSGRVTDSRIVGDILYIVSSEYSYYYGPPILLMDEPISAPPDIMEPTPNTFTVAKPAPVTVDSSDIVITNSTGSSGIATPGFTGYTGSSGSVGSVSTAEGIAVEGTTSITGVEVSFGGTGQNIYIASIDISNPEDIHLVDRVDFGGFANYIHVAEEVIFVESSTYSYPEQTTEITYVDISDPAGNIEVRGSIELPGTIQDKFKMDYYDGYFRVCTYEWNRGISNLYVIDTLNPDSLEEISSVQLGKGEQLFATRFDGERAYMVTFERIDPLWVLDLSNPENPEIKGELEVPGWSTHIEPLGDRLIALGVDDSNGRKVSVSLFDVSDTKNPGLIKRLSFGSENGWATTEAYVDVKAFTVLDDMGLILLPYSTSDYSDGYYRQDNRLQLIDYSDRDITARGWISQNGSVLRSRSFLDRLFSVSSDELQVIDATDRDNPRITASLTLARNIIDFMPLDNGYGVQLINQSSGGYILRAVALSDPEEGEVASEFTLDNSSYPSIISNGNLVYVVTNHYESYYDYPEKLVQDIDLEPAIAIPVEGGVEKSIAMPAREYYKEWTHIQIYDFNNISNPTKRGFLDVSGTYSGIRPLGKNDPIFSYNGSDIIQVKGAIFVFNKTQSYYYPYPYYTGVAEVDGMQETEPEFRGFLVADLSDYNDPKIVAQIPFTQTNPLAFFAYNEIFYLSYREEIDQKDNEKRFQSKYYLVRINMANPSSPVRMEDINIPGYCVGVDNSGKFVYTINNEWPAEEESYDYYQQDYSFNAVKIVNDTAYLFDTIELEGSSYTTIIDNGYAYLAGSGFYGYYGGGYYGGYSSFAPRSPYYGGNNECIIIDLSDPDELIEYKHSFEGVGCNILGEKNKKIFINSGLGIGVYNISDPKKPKLEEFRQGYSSNISYDQTKAYVPLGYYGLWVESL